MKEEEYKALMELIEAKIASMLPGSDIVEVSRFRELEAVFMSTLEQVEEFIDKSNVQNLPERTVNTIRIDVYKRAGQSAWRPKVQSVVRATCLECGLYVESFEERSEHMNMIVAKQRLKDLKVTLLNSGQEEIAIYNKDTFYE